jgi:hypothetical protein
LVTYVLSGVTDIVQMGKFDPAVSTCALVIKRREVREVVGPWRSIISLTAAHAAGAGVEHESDQGFAIVDFVGGDEGEGL